MSCSTERHPYSSDGQVMVDGQQYEVVLWGHSDSRDKGGLQPFLDGFFVSEEVKIEDCPAAPWSG